MCEHAPMLSPDAVAYARAALPPPPARVLEVGAGEGELAAVLGAAGYDVTAIDPRGGDGVAPGRARGPRGARRAPSTRRSRWSRCTTSSRSAGRCGGFGGAAPRRAAGRRRVRRRALRRARRRAGGCAIPATASAPPTTSPRCASTCTRRPHPRGARALVRRLARPSRAPTCTAGTSTRRSRDEEEALIARGSSPAMGSRASSPSAPLAFARAGARPSRRARTPARSA